MKAYTDIEQSKKLAKILPIESADMHYYKNHFDDYIEGLYNSNDLKDGFELKGIEYVPAWSLAALLSILPKTVDHETLFIETSPVLWHIGYRNVYIARTDNPIDACYELILKLNELNLL